MVTVYFALLKSSKLLSLSYYVKIIVLKFFLIWKLYKSALQEESDFLLAPYRSIGMPLFQDFHCDIQNADTDYTIENDELFSSLVWEAL